MSFFKPFFIIFQSVIASSILTAAVSVGELGGLNVVEEVASMYVQWPGQKAKELFFISIIIPCFFIYGWQRIIR